MRTNRLIVVGIAGLLSCFGWLCISPAPAEQGNASAPKSLAEAAESAYKATVASYEAGKGTVEDIYRWSRRLMEAQQAEGKNPEAKAAHLARMNKLQQKVEARYMTGSVAGEASAYYATKFYVLEAEADKLK
jgi:membrane-bound lytic murein transglycosylase